MNHVAAHGVTVFRLEEASPGGLVKRVSSLKISSRDKNKNNIKAPDFESDS